MLYLLCRLKGLGSYVPPAENYPNPVDDPPIARLSRHDACSRPIKKFGIKHSLVRRRSRRYAFSLQSDHRCLRHRTDTISRLRGAVPFTYDLAVLQLKNTRQHTLGSPGFTSECSWQLTYDLLESASEEREGSLIQGKKFPRLIIMKRGVVDRY